jgi:agarase
MIDVTDRSVSGGVTKEMLNGLDSTCYTDGKYGISVDAFAPGYQAFATQRVGQVAAWYTQNPATSPWIVGITMDDADYTAGLKSITHFHPGWVIAATAPTQTSNANYGLTYSDTTVYSKLAWQTYLQTKYNTLAALNAAWGSDYSSWGSSSQGWPRHLTGGKGLLDEDGCSPWLHTTDYHLLPGISATIKADLDGILLQYARQYFQVMTTAAHTYFPNHMVFNAAAWDANNRAPVLQAAGEYLDALALYTQTTQPTDIAYVTQAYNIAHKPIFLWTTLFAQQDSPLAGQSYGPWPADLDNPTQDARGQKYSTYLNALFNLQAGDGSYPVVGIDWWEWTDKTVGGEHTNFGLVTNKDNPYDGVADQIKTGVDAWGYPTGGEAANYGNFLGPVTTTNQGIVQGIVKQVH